MAITGIDNSSYTSYYASGYKNTVKKAACDIQKNKGKFTGGQNRRESGRLCKKNCRKKILK